MEYQGGPAFPLHTPVWHEAVSREGYEGQDFTMGMTLRDYFAAKAMQGFLSGRMFNFDEPERDAKLAYELADAMLKARGE